MVTGILVWILSYFVPKYALGLENYNKLSWILNMLLNLLPNMSLHYGYSIMSGYEERGIKHLKCSKTSILINIFILELGMQWSNLATSSSGGSNDLTMLNIFLMLIIDMVLYMLFTMYMDKVNPGQYGIRESVLFPFKNIIKVNWGTYTGH